MLKILVVWLAILVACILWIWGMAVLDLVAVQKFPSYRTWLIKKRQGTSVRNPNAKFKLSKERAVNAAILYTAQLPLMILVLWNMSWPVCSIVISVSAGVYLLLVIVFWRSEWHA